MTASELPAGAWRVPPRRCRSFHSEHIVTLDQKTSKERHAVIVGGNSGMGLALADRLLRQGGAVTLVGRSRDKLEAARAHLADAGVPRLEQADVASEDEVRSLFDRTGPLDHLVCTAADIRGSYVLLPEL